MARDRTARARVRQLLATSGPVRDPSGYATGDLKDAIGYSGSAVAFIQLVAAMERDGEIVRKIRGKRTYEIAATPQTVESATTFPESGGAAARPRDAGARIELDYDELAKAILRQLWAGAKANAPVADAAPPVAEHDEYTRKLEAARAKLDELLDVERHRSDTSAAKG